MPLFEIAFLKTSTPSELAAGCLPERLIGGGIQAITAPDRDSAIAACAADLASENGDDVSGCTIIVRAFRPS